MVIVGFLLRRLNESIAEDKRKHEAEATKYRTEAASKELQERVRELLDVQQQLHNIKTVLTDEQQKADRFQQLHCSSAKEVQELQQKLTVRQCLFWVYVVNRQRD